MIHTHLKKKACESPTAQVLWMEAHAPMATSMVSVDRNPPKDEQDLEGMGLTKDEGGYLRG